MSRLPLIAAFAALSVLCSATAQNDNDLKVSGWCNTGTGTYKDFLTAFGEVRNTRSFPVRARGEFIVKDPSGNTLVLRHSQLPVFTLNPGETAPVYANADLKGRTRIGGCSLRYVYESATEGMRGEVSGLKVSQNINPWGNTATVTGEVSNPHGLSVRYQVLVTGYNSAGEVVLVAEGTPFNTLNARSSTSFRILTNFVRERAVRFKTLVALTERR